MLSKFFTLSALVLASFGAFSQDNTTVEFVFAKQEGEARRMYAAGEGVANDYNEDGCFTGSVDIVYYANGMVFEFFFNACNEEITMIGPDGTIFTYKYAYEFGDSVTYSAVENTDFVSVF